MGRQSSAFSRHQNATHAQKFRRCTAFLSALAQSIAPSLKTFGYDHPYVQDAQGAYAVRTLSQVVTPPEVST